MTFINQRTSSLFFALVMLVAGAASASTLDKVKKRGEVVCDVNGSLPGFSIKRDGSWHGIDVDLCRAVAAAVLGDAGKARMMPSATRERINALASGDADILAHNTTWTLTRDTSEGIQFVGVNYFDGQGFIVPRAKNWRSALELGGASVCVIEGTTSALNLRDYFTHNRMSYTANKFTDTSAAIKAFTGGQCDVFTTDQSALFALRASMPNGADYRILPEFISKEPLGPAVRNDDAQWFNIVRWTLFVMLEAEELGIESGNVDHVRKVARKPQIRRLLGVEGAYGEELGLDADWAYRIIKQVGNYAESFERNLGESSGIDMYRGQNALWLDGGLMYAPPVR